ncbi:hypothetical protein M3Y97_00136600 [Aphelenchoides bicaudatus]|nr:hypothetical protein M3Y97_00136600 [Aphelenchoides bicaudatus]
MSRFFTNNPNAKPSPFKARRESNLRFLTNAPKRPPHHAIRRPQVPLTRPESQAELAAPPLLPSLVPSLVPSLKPPTQEEQNDSPSLLLPTIDQTQQEPTPPDNDDDEIIFIGEEMGGDPKSDSRNSSSRRDDSRGHSDRRSGGQSDRNETRRDSSRGDQVQKRDYNGSSKQPRFPGSGSSSFSSQMKSIEGRGPVQHSMRSVSFTQEIPKKKFTTRCRLFVGNLPNEMEEAEFKELFKEFGESSEAFLSGKGFGFIRLDTRAHAETAKETLDGKTVKGRQLRVRFAVNGAIVKVKELSPTVSNEMLYHTFSVFGDVERAIHIVDERGKPTGEGIVEFERKASAQDALRSINERVFIMTAQSHPIQVELMEAKDEDDGLAERMIQRTAQSMKEREVPPHFADEKSFEFSYGMRWKELYKHEKEQREQLEQQILNSRRQLETDQEMAFEDYQAEKIREELEQRKRELERLEEMRRNRPTRPPDFSAPWGSGPMREGFGEPLSMHPPVFPVYGQPPPNFGVPPLNAFDGPQNRPNPTYGREPRFFGGPEDSDIRNQEKQPFGPDIEKILQSFRGNEEPPNRMNKGYGNENPFAGPPPFNAPILPLSSIPPQLMKGPQHGRLHQMPPEKRTRR